MSRKGEILALSPLLELRDDRSNREPCAPAGDEQDDDVAALQMALRRVIESKQNRAQQKQAEVVRQCEADLATELDQLATAVTRGCKDMTTSAGKQFSSLESQLKQVIQQIEECHQRHQQELNEKWQAYSDVYSQMDDLKASAVAGLKSKSAGLKKRIQTLEQSTAKRLKEADTQMQNLKSKSSKVPNLADMFSSLLQ